MSRGGIRGDMRTAMPLGDKPLDEARIGVMVLGYFFYGALALGIPTTAAIAYTTGAYWPMGILAAFVGGFFIGAAFTTNLIVVQTKLLLQKNTTKETSNHGKET